MQENQVSQEVKQEVSREDEIKALKEELAALKKEREEKAFNESLNKKIEELVNQRLSEREASERERIEKAREMIAEADRNAALEEELMANDKYNRIANWRENKENEFRREVEILARMGRESKHPANMYRDYDLYLAGAQRGDERAKTMLGYINLTHACMSLGGEGMLNILKKNIGVVE